MDNASLLGNLITFSSLDSISITFFFKLLRRIFLICQRPKEQSKEQKKKTKNGI